eukprot:TRINITY_DN20037_c0_g1_i1.p1 TRINITY_DN20037_c0_g1~~TRINITY_DN20037_c0_g1_i1.p1  ORF type:complete len:148 (-),score=32.86 TRINITY_DN20037_c0_g1_i1:984-1427(-)
MKAGKWATESLAGLANSGALQSIADRWQEKEDVDDTTQKKLDKEKVKSPEVGKASEASTTAPSSQTNAPNTIQVPDQPNPDVVVGQKDEEKPTETSEANKSQDLTDTGSDHSDDEGESSGGTKVGWSNGSFHVSTKKIKGNDGTLWS